MAIYSSITELIGNTPLVELSRITDGAPGRVLAKLEFFNPASSVKDRIALAMIRAAEDAGALTPGTKIVEATSGNTGIGLAMVGAALGYPVILTMPESMSMERRILLRAYGAELILTEAGKGMQGAVDAAQEIADRGEGVLIRQFANPANPQVHRETTAQEILKDTGGDIHTFVAGIGTGGTITGVGNVLKETDPTIQVHGVEPAESAILNGGAPGPHPIQGIGANFIPDILDRDVYDHIHDIDGPTAMETARRAGRDEGLLVGISSGAILAAAIKVAQNPAMAGKTVVAMVPSNGERYLSTPLYSSLAD